MCARLWRNNSGAWKDKRGVWIRYGLGNESKAINDEIKSSDLIGITSKIVTQDMVGKRIGIFTAIEVKAPGWKFRWSDARAVAQMKFLEIIINLGGIGMFVTSDEEMEL